MSKRKLNDLQYAAIAILSQPKRAGLTFEEVADKVGVHRDTLQRWRKLDEFNAELKNEIIRNTLDRLPEIMDSIPDHIITDGNAALFRTLLQAHGMLTDKVEIDTKSGGVDVDAMKAQIERMKSGQERSQ